METMERHLVKIFLQEISRPPGPEMENAICRESHSLAAGFALGMVLLGVISRYTLLLIIRFSYIFTRIK